MKIIYKVMHVLDFSLSTLDSKRQRNHAFKILRGHSIVVECCANPNYQLCEDNTLICSSFQGLRKSPSQAPFLRSHKSVCSNKATCITWLIKNCNPRSKEMSYQATKKHGGILKCIFLTERSQSL